MFVERINSEAEDSNLKDRHDHRLKELEAAHSETVFGLNSRIVVVSNDLRNTKAHLQRLKIKIKIKTIRNSQSYQSSPGFK
jgi:hypothetical protein